MITELVGPAGVGKTQACLMLAAQACLPARLGGLGEDAGVVYLDTERKVRKAVLTLVTTWPSSRH